MTAVRGRQKIVLLGSISKMPVAGEVWLTGAYLLGFERLGFEVYYVEAHARTPTTLMERDDDDSSALAAGYIDSVMRRLDLADRWALHALHADGEVFGLSRRRLARLYRDAATIINLHGGTLPREELTATGRLTYLETDPVELEVQLFNGDADAAAMLDAHCAFFSYGLNYGRSDCRVPLPPGLRINATVPPVLLDQWSLAPFGRRSLFTTIGNWRQEWRDVNLSGEVYHWSKHLEFAKFVELPHHTEQRFELALASDTAEDRAWLEQHGWRVRDAARLSADADSYRRYIVDSRGEFTVAKDQNVRLRSGWFSDRSATYLAAGCPVVTQDTGFGERLPTGDGLFAFATLGQILDAVERINRDHAASSAAALQIAREHFDAERVLGRLVDELALTRPHATSPVLDGAQLPPDLELKPRSRWPTLLQGATATTLMTRSLPAPARRGVPLPEVSVIVATCENLVFTRMCLESVLAGADLVPFELIVIDNGSLDGTQDYLQELAAADARIRIELGACNFGFPAAANLGLAAARGDLLVLLNNDTIVAPGWLSALGAHLVDEGLGLIGAVSNRAATEAQIETDYSSYGEFLELARRRADAHARERTPIGSLTLFCAALRRSVYDEVGPLDERFGLGMFEDDDYVARVRRAGYEIACAEDVYVHHFGQASIGWLARTGAYGALFEQNRRMYNEKWATSWRPHRQRPSAARERMIQRARELVGELVPTDGTVLVVSKGDERLLELSGRTCRHFPQDAAGAYTGFHPPDADEAIAELERLRELGASHLLIPKPSLWWLEHYADLRRHLEQTGSLLAHDEHAGALFALRGTPLTDSERRAA